MSVDTVCLWRRRFRLLGISGLSSQPRPGRPARVERMQAELTGAAAGRRGDGHPSTSASAARAVGPGGARIRRRWDQPASGALAPGTIVGLFLDHPLRLMIRVAEAGPSGRPAIARSPFLKQSRQDRQRSSGPATILPALEAFRPPRTRVVSPGEVRLFIQDVDGFVSSPLTLEVVGFPSRVEGVAGVTRFPAGERARTRWIRCRTIGEWMRVVAAWIAAIPDQQHRSMTSLLGHLTDYLAAWRDDRPPFTWTLPGATATEQARRYASRTS